ncbi:unnamed protein product [Thlaspi arvense]|uniref:Fe2OG dioxygenase domain-containing protein n=1 Tax=Thlaspi arvense TaxID=13288 RepID=A0AAU9SK79_THLAR|nr:unnamed protein product [Thlaspi arvense]
MHRKRVMENKTDPVNLTIEVSSLHCIDLANSNLHQTADLLKQACKDCGFFYVINHGISAELEDEAFEQSKKFFALPLEEKMKVFRNEKYRGYSPVLDQMLDPENQVQGDYKVGFTIGFEGPKDVTHWDIEKPFYSPNIWPNHDVLLGWRETMEKYYQEALRVCKTIARIMALALDLDENYFDTPEMLGNPIADMICKDKDSKPQKWEYVPSIKGAFIVNLGDLLERWSNGYFKSTLHRVLGTGQDRYSIPFFVKPSHNCVIECLPTCQSENNLPKYPAIKCLTLLSQHYKAAHAHHKQT